MALTNCYADLADVYAELGIADARDTGRAERALNAASRLIDAHTGRRFWQDGSVVARTYVADSSMTVRVDDISTTTGLIVKSDQDSDGTFETTHTITTHFVLYPLNAALQVPAWPYTEIVLVDGDLFPVWSNGRPGVQVTAKFGWPAVPDDVRQACVIQAVQEFKAADAVFGGLSFGDGSLLRVRRGINPMAAELLEGFCLPRVA